MGQYIIQLINAIAQLYIILILIRSIMTWLRQDIIFQMQAFFALVAKLVDPLLMFVRRTFPVRISNMDFSPILAILIIVIIKMVLTALLGMLFYGGV